MPNASSRDERSDSTQASTAAATATAIAMKNEDDTHPQKADAAAAAAPMDSTAKIGDKSTGLTRVGAMYQVACIPAIQTTEAFSEAVSRSLTWWSEPVFHSKLWLCHLLLFLLFLLFLLLFLLFFCFLFLLFLLFLLLLILAFASVFSWHTAPSHSHQLPSRIRPPSPGSARRLSRSRPWLGRQISGLIPPPLAVATGLGRCCRALW